MHIEILTPEKKLFTGDAYGIQLPGVSGSFEVLEKHAPMVSALGNGVVKILLDKSGKNNNNYTIKSGFIEVLNNKVTVLLEGVTEA
jgi:F-type H+-transporting ATPase subunit epsilon